MAAPNKPGLEMAEHGFSLMEVLVAVAVFGILFVTLFGLVSTTLRNIARIEERERMVRLSQMKLNEIALAVYRGDPSPLQAGQFDEKYRWESNVSTLDNGEESDRKPPFQIVRIRLSVLWPTASGSGRYSLETVTWAPN
ncbi:MAG: type II secretion system GspH family protein [Acidobacteria bacterium]|nr:type II secretion system GspH family protein [Acidobacteriota bacterium]MCI0623455.1 type II secretion system GspH family protein [Acidobacteriota bacterium]MCI0724502.1 type II secretion system GspH family protein [Acidobacteriota bacterium]